MIDITVPGREQFQIDHLVCDVNGTIALDGMLLDGVQDFFERLSQKLTVHLLTANTHGLQNSIDQSLGIKAHIILAGDEKGQKEAFVNSLKPAGVVAIGQGANDAGMLKSADIGIAVMSKEGLAVQTLLAADIVVPDIFSAFNLLEKPLRLTATMRL